MRLIPTGVTETAFAARAGVEILNQVEFRLHHRHKNQLGDALARLNRKTLLTAIPHGNHQLALIIRINQANQIAQYDAVLMAETGARQNHRGQRRVGDMNSQAGRQQRRCARRQLLRRIKAGA